MARNFTFQRLTDIFNGNSPTESVSEDYNGPQSMILIVDPNGNWNLHEYIMPEDGSPEISADAEPADNNIQTGDETEDGEYFVVLDETNDNHVILMAAIDGRDETENDMSYTYSETLATINLDDGTSFEFRDMVIKTLDAEDTFDLSSTTIDRDGSVNYAYKVHERMDSEADKTVLKNTFESYIKSSINSRNEAPLLEQKQVWKKYIELLTKIKDSCLDREDWYKFYPPTVTEMQLGKTFNQQDLINQI